MAERGTQDRKSDLKSQVEAELRIPTVDEEPKPGMTSVAVGEATYTKMLSKRW